MGKFNPSNAALFGKLVHVCSVVDKTQQDITEMKLLAAKIMTEQQRLTKAVKDFDAKLNATEKAMQRN